MENDQETRRRLNNEACLRYRERNREKTRQHMRDKRAAARAALPEPPRIGRPKGSKNKKLRFNALPEEIRKELERRESETEQEWRRRYAARVTGLWRERNREKVREYERERRAAKREANGGPKVRGRDRLPRKNARPEWLRKECEIRPGETPEAHRQRVTNAAVAWWRSNHPEQDFRTNKAHHLRRFRLTLEEYNALLEEQGHACAICKMPERAPAWKQQKPRMLAVDHCHKTGKIRGLLCFRCNTVVGHIEESLETAMSLYHYLDKHAEFAPITGH